MSKYIFGPVPSRRLGRSLGVDLVIPSLDAGSESTFRRVNRPHEDIANGLGMHRNEVIKYVEELTAERRLVQACTGGQRYYHTIQ